MLRLRTPLIFAALLTTLASCSLLGDPLPVDDHASETERIHIVTRTSLVEEAPPVTHTRQAPIRFERVDVTIPSMHRPGQIEWPRPRASGDGFRLSRYRTFSDADAFGADIARQDTGDDVTLVFVHGYNTSTAKAVLRFAQIKSDFRQTAPSVVFAWPSAANPRAYAYDRDSVLFARDDLVDTLDLLARHSDRDIAIIAHSMGSLLAMEALRQIALTGRTDLQRRIVWMTLVSPDIDPDVFRAQAESIGTLPREFYIFATRQDKALSLSSFLAGGRGRVGIINEAAPFEGLDVTVLDLGEFAGVGVNHGIGFSSPGAISALIGLDDGTPPPRDGRAEVLVLGARG